MKILHVIPYFTPKRGGDVNVCYNLSKQLIKKGHEVTIITTDFEHDREYGQSIEGLQVVAFKCLINISLFLYSPDMKRWVQENIRNFDVIHLHQFRSYQNNVIHNYAKKYQIPYTLQPHGSTPRTTGKNFFKWIYDKIWGQSIMKDAGRVIAVSKEEAIYDHEIGADNEKIYVIYNGMDLQKSEHNQKYGNFKKKYGINTKMILYIGRIHKLKGIDFLIKAFSQLMDEIDDVVLVIAGPDDGYKEKLVKQIKILNLTDKVIFTGFLGEEDKISAYIDADLFVHTVIYMGGVGLTPLEALLFDTPVIVTKQCGEVIEESKSGYLVEYGDINDLKEKMRYVLENPEEQKAMTERGKKYIEKNLTWKKVSRKIENIYNGLTP